MEGGCIVDAKFEVTAQCGLTNEQPRGKREERCEVRSAKCVVGSRQWLGPRRAGWQKKGLGPRRQDGRVQREARRDRERENYNPA